MKKARIVLVSLSALLAGCQSTGSGFYQFYYGYFVMFDTITMPTETVSAIRVQNEITGKEDLDLRGDYTFLYDSSDIHDYLETYRSYLSEEDVTKFYQENSGEVLLAYRIQIPEGYQAYRRNNAQKINPENRQILVTPAFYYYENRPEISYLYTDVIKDDTVTSDYVFGGVYHLDASYQSQAEETRIRLILSDHAVTESELWIDANKENEDSTLSR